MELLLVEQDFLPITHTFPPSCTNQIALILIMLKNALFTQLNKITRLIFPQPDDHILQYLDDDGTPVEPIYYAPIIPMVLVNGSEGIGTGFSTFIPKFSAKE